MPLNQPPVAAGTGWLAESYDSRDKPYRSQAGGKMEERVNLVEVNPKWLEAVYDQVDTGSCVANATAAAYRFCAHKINATSQSKVLDDPSRLFIYYNARLLPALEEAKFTTQSGNTPKTVPFPTGSIDPKGGSENRNSFKGMNIYGVCSEKTWPWENVEVEVNKNGKKVKKTRPQKLNDCPEDAAYTEAKLARAVEYCRLDPDHPDELETNINSEERQAVGVVTLMQVKQCLSEGYPVVFGFWFYWDPLPWKQYTDTKEWYLDPLPTEMQHNPEQERHGGHTVLIVGYDNKRKQVLVQNSWGTKATEEGTPRFWMPYNWITDWECTDDFWMVRLIEEKGGQKKA
ncbi:hypothetical protein H2200_003987 [Cladophialophora chaetospira]|uniref:Peptidase C1A papain C-terminal domain-containing protein n=1 Tax=Cladophialophora chaetospira TaxID=386627 RepID=A0AA38XF96_9EURO|nr:hypothetical protein H2200_003987 [Cladophialophora chaetospira]